MTPQINVIVPCLPLICAEPKPFQAIEEAYRNSVIWITKIQNKLYWLAPREQITSACIAVERS